MMPLKRDSLARGTGPMLRDGTTLLDLIDLDRREVAMRVLSDPELYRLELQHIFARAWVGVAHVSELTNVGDFVMRHIGEDRVIVTRTFGGHISVIFRSCSMFAPIGALSCARLRRAMRPRSSALTMVGRSTARAISLGRRSRRKCTATGTSPSTACGGPGWRCAPESCLPPSIRPAARWTTGWDPRGGT